MEIGPAQHLTAQRSTRPDPVDPFVAAPGAVPFGDYLEAVNRVDRIEAPDVYEPSAAPAHEDARACRETRACEDAPERARAGDPVWNSNRGTPTLADVAPVVPEPEAPDARTTDVFRQMSPLGAMIDLTV